MIDVILVFIGGVSLVACLIFLIYSLFKTSKPYTNGVEEIRPVNPILMEHTKKVDNSELSTRLKKTIKTTNLTIGGMDLKNITDPKQREAAKRMMDAYERDVK